MRARAESALALAAKEYGWPLRGGEFRIDTGGQAGGAAGSAAGGVIGGLSAIGAMIDIQSAAGGEATIADSKLKQSIVLVSEPQKLKLSNVNLDGSVLQVSAASNGSWSLRGLDSCSLESALVNIDYSNVEAAVRAAPPDQRFERLADMHRPVLNLISSIPERYAATKVGLVRDFISHLKTVGATSASEINQLAALMRSSPDLMQVPEIRAAVTDSLAKSIKLIWENGSVEDISSIIDSLRRGMPPVVAELAKADPNYQHMRALLTAAAKPREVSAEQRDAFVEAFLSANPRLRNEIVSKHSGATALLLTPRSDEAALDSAQANPKLDQAHQQLIQHPAVRAALSVWPRDVVLEFDDSTSAEEINKILLTYSKKTAVIVNGDQHAVCLTGEALKDFVAAKPINSHIIDIQKVHVIDRRPDNANVGNSGAFAADVQQTGGMREFDRLKDTAIDPLLRSAVVPAGASVISANLEHYFPGSPELRELFRTVPTTDRGRLPIRLGNEQRAAVEAALGQLTEGGRDRLVGSDWPNLRLTSAHLDGLRNGMRDLGIEDTPANFSAYLFQLATVFTRYSSVAAFGTEAEAFFAVRAYAHGLLNHAREVSRPLAEAERRIPSEAYLTGLSNWLSSPECAAIISGQMFAASHQKAPQLYDIYAPEGWKHLGTQNRARALAGALP